MQKPQPPEFTAQLGRGEVHMTFDEERGAVVARSRRRVLLDVPLVAGQEPLKLDGNVLTWGSRELTVPDDQLGMATAFAHYVNQRTPLSEHERHLGDPMPGVQRWQYGVVNIGMFRSLERMQEVLATAGANGWELVAVYDKASNWLSGLEKGFMLLKRPVPDGVEPDEWCVAFSG